MKPENENLYRRVADQSGKETTLVTRELLPDKPGYQITFTPTHKGLLRRQPYRHTDERHFFPYSDWVHTYAARDREVHTFTLNQAIERDGNAETSVNYSIEPHQESNEITHLYVSDAGLDLVNALGYGFFRNGVVYRPELWHGELIGKGSESLVYRATLRGKDCVVKLVNYENIKWMNEISFLGGVYPEPNYLRKFGITSQVSEMISGLEQIRPFKSFEIAPSPIEYVAGKDFLIGEFERRATVSHIQKFISKLDKKKISNGAVEYWRQWFESFKQDIALLDDLFFTAGTERGNPFNQTDLSPQDWIIMGFDRNSGKLRLALIDQVSAGILYSGIIQDGMFMEKDERYKELSDKYQDSPLLNYLRNCPIPK